MVTYPELRGKLIDYANAHGIEITNKSGLNSSSRFANLMSNVSLVMAAAELSPEETEAVLMTSAPNLPKAWHRYDEDAKAIVQRYLTAKSRGEAYGQKGDGEGGEQGGNGGEGRDQGQDQGEGQGQGQGQDQDQDQNGQGEGQGQGEGEGEGEQGQGQDQGEGQGQDQKEDESEDGMASEAIPPEDAPSDPDYIPPKCWMKVLRIVKWNMAHPGKQIT